MKTRVPLLDLGYQNRPITNEVMIAVRKIINDNRFVLGKPVTDLEGAIAKLSGARYAVGVSSGTDALLASMTALGIGPGDIVIAPAYTFLPSAGCALRLGAEPRFVDVDEETLNIDPAKLEKFFKANRSIAKRVKAVVPVHLFGQCADMKTIMKICRQHGVTVLEDAAQAIGTVDSSTGKVAGTMGVLGCLSFYPTKNLGGMGDGGMVLTSNSKLRDVLITLRNHGSMRKRYVHDMVGGNFRLDAMQAAILSVKLKTLKKFDRMRVENAKIYLNEFKKSGLVDGEFIKLPVAKSNPRLVASNRTHLFNQYSIRAKKRDGLLKFLAGRGIGSEVYYPVPMHLQPCFKNLGYKRGDFPVAEKLASESLALPIYPGLKPAQIKLVVKEIKNFYKR